MACRELLVDPQAFQRACIYSMLQSFLCECKVRQPRYPRAERAHIVAIVEVKGVIAIGPALLGVLRVRAPKPLRRLSRNAIIDPHGHHEMQVRVLAAITRCGVVDRP